MTDPLVNNFRRMMETHFGPSYSEAVTALVDALRGYIRSDEDAERDAQIEGWTVTQEQSRKWAAHMQTIRLLLKELERVEVDPWLNGTIEYKRSTT